MPLALEMCHGLDRVDNYNKDNDQKANQKETENETEINNQITVYRHMAQEWERGQRVGAECREKKQENEETPHPKHKDPLRCPRHRKNPPHGYQKGGQPPARPPASQPKTLDPQEPLENINGEQNKKGNPEGVGW